MAFDPTGNYFEVPGSPRPGRSALFLDRDGVIIEDRHYLADPTGVELIPSTVRLVRRFRAADHAIVVVTNQSGIGRGLFGWDAFHAVQDRLRALWRDEGIAWDMLLACPHHPSEGLGRYARDDDWRKPRPGMIAHAARLLDLDLPSSTLVGDRPSDIEAGRAGGVKRLILYAREMPLMSSENTGETLSRGAVGLRSLDELHPA